MILLREMIWVYNIFHLYFLGKEMIVFIYISYDKQRLDILLHLLVYILQSRGDGKDNKKLYLDIIFLCYRIFE